MVILSHIYTLQWIHSPSFGYARQLTLCMRVTLSREGVVFLVFLFLLHFTEVHVLPSPVSEPNWRSLFRPGRLSPTPPKMASSFTGSAHSPFPGCDTLTKVKNSVWTGTQKVKLWHSLYCSFSWHGRQINTFKALYFYRVSTYCCTVLKFEPKTRSVFIEISVPDKRSRILEVVLVRRLVTWILGIWSGEGMGKGWERGGQFTSNLCLGYK
jgi:hypothetical protein